jgi:hypothetical protein
MNTYKIIELTDGSLAIAVVQNTDEPATLTGTPTFANVTLPDGAVAKVINFIDDVGNILILG